MCVLFSFEMVKIFLSFVNIVHSIGNRLMFKSKFYSSQKFRENHGNLKNVYNINTLIFTTQIFYI